VVDDDDVKVILDGQVDDFGSNILLSGSENGVQALLPKAGLNQFLSDFF
jgi:hypothetical protein